MNKSAEMSNGEENSLAKKLSKIYNLLLSIYKSN